MKKIITCPRAHLGIDVGFLLNNWFNVVWKVNKLITTYLPLIYSDLLCYYLFYFLGISGSISLEMLVA